MSRKKLAIVGSRSFTEHLIGYIETDKIINAQKARGADFETGSFVQRVKALMPVLIPLFVSAFRRAEELALPHVHLLRDAGAKEHRLERTRRETVVVVDCGPVEVAPPDVALERLVHGAVSGNKVKVA